MNHRVEYLQYEGATGKTPILSINKDSQWHQIREYDITAATRDVVYTEGIAIIFTKVYTSARSLRAGGVTALIMAQVEP